MDYKHARALARLTLLENQVRASGSLLPLINCWDHIAVQRLKERQEQQRDTFFNICLLTDSLGKSDSKTVVNCGKTLIDSFEGGDELAELREFLLKLDNNLPIKKRECWGLNNKCICQATFYNWPEANDLLKSFGGVEWSRPNNISNHHVV